MRAVVQRVSRASSSPGGAIGPGLCILLGVAGGDEEPAAARPELAIPVYERFVAAMRGLGIHVETGVFGARMAIELENDGPVTIVLDG